MDLQDTEYKIIIFQKKYEEEWDSFVLNESYNGCFLQTRKFLNYHPVGKFLDCSLMFYKKNQLVAVSPACEVRQDDEKIFSSHSGSTYGGIILSPSMLRAEKILNLLDEFESYLTEQGFTKCILKQTNPLLSQVPTELLEYCLYYKRYKEYKELNSYIDFAYYDKTDILKNFSKLKKRFVKKCINADMEVKELTDENDIERFHEVLSNNLQKYHLIPYHTVEDLVDLKRRFPNDIEFWGCIYEEKIVAVSMVFLFENSKCAHTQYLAANSEYASLSPMTYIYYKMVDIYKDRDIRYLSWGITTEHLGLEINKNLTNSKEEYGSRHNITKIYEKVFSSNK